MTVGRSKRRLFLTLTFLVKSSYNSLRADISYFLIEHVCAQAEFNSYSAQACDPASGLLG